MANLLPTYSTVTYDQKEVGKMFLSTVRFWGKSTNQMLGSKLSKQVVSSALASIKTKLLATTIFPVVHGGTFLLAGWCWSLVPWLQGMATDGIEGGVGYLVPFFSQTRSRTFRYTWNLNFKWSVVRIRFYPQVEGQHWNIYIWVILVPGRS